MNSTDDEENAVFDGVTDRSNTPLIVSSHSSTNSLVPLKDRFNIVYWIFYLLGIGCLLPWNFFSNASRYFSYKLRNVTLNESSTFQSDSSVLTEDQILFLNYLEMAALVPSVLFTVFNVVITNKISMNKRVVCSLIVLLLLFLLTAIFTVVKTDDWQKVFMCISLTTVGVMNAAVAVLQGGLYGLAGKFPERYMQSLMGGMALGGLFAAATSLAIISLGVNPVSSGLCYFAVALLANFLGLVCFLILPKLKFAKYYMNQQAIHKGAAQDYIDIVVNTLSASRSKQSTVGEIFSVFKQIWVYSISSCLVFGITLACYPALISAIKSSSSNVLWRDVYFSPVACFLIFNLFDVVGRSGVSFLKWPSIKHPFLVGLLSLLRLTFVPAFFFCNIQPRKYTTPFFTSDWIPILLNALLGWSNGHLVTLCMMYAPRMVQGDQVELAGSIMSFSLSAGLGLGSVCAMCFARNL